MSNEEMLAERIYALKLGHFYSQEGQTYTRVPGGFIVTLDFYSTKTKNSVFVPYSNEFNKHHKLKRK